MRAIDLFAGIGGWDLACRELGWDADGVEKWDDARTTRDAAGLVTVHDDVLTYRGKLGSYDLVLGSPPCQTFSRAGKQAGTKAMQAILDHIIGRGGREVLDERSALVGEPLRVVLEIMPTYVAWEQVPAVLPIWQACAEVLRSYGYSVVTGCLNAEQYGVPQTRRRAILVARRDGLDAQLPQPTHSKYNVRNPGGMEAGVEPWVSMADALGWGMTRRPSMTVTGGSSATGGAEPFGNGARKSMLAQFADEGWLLRPTNARPNMAMRDVAKPAATLAFGKDFPKWVNQERGIIKVTIGEVLVLQSFPGDYPMRGSRTSQFLQVANAIPPKMAKAILKQLVA